MTQDQIDQLIAFASAEIDRHMAGLTIQGGNGVTVDGYAADQVVSVQVPHTEPENPPPPPELTTTLWITITGTEVRNIQGETETIVIDSGRQSVANLTRKSSAWFADWDAWIIDASGELGTQKRSVVFTLQ
ncbi:MAG TPA: hypothetical protein VD994_07885, partial [Prosthecobacter sp.]|nr:hypothetical protein [Prosthecobacter sp.]